MGWEGTIGIALAFAGLGVGVLSLPPQPIIWLARLCFVIAALLLCGKSIWWSITTTNPYWIRYIITGLVSAGALIGLSESLRYVDEHFAPPAENKPTAAAIEQSAILPKTLLQLYTADFSNLLKLSKDIPINKSETLKFNIYNDYAANTKFIGFYIPASADTYQDCVHLADTYKKLMDDLGNSIPTAMKTPADHSYMSSHDLAFSGRVYIYHETDLSLEQLGALTALYRKKRLNVQFRGSSYTTTRWLQDKAAK